MNGHPSYLSLDGFALGASDATTEAHVRSCARCATYLSQLQPSPMPECVRRLEQDRRSRWPSWFRLPHLAAVGAAAALAAIVLPGVFRHEDLAAKGSPSVAVYVKHGATVSLWDGRALLSPGDGLQLKVAPDGFSRVTVASVAAARVVELFASEIDPRGETTLPRSWTLDAEPGPEVVLVLFSRTPLSPADLRAARDDLPRTRRLWSTRVELFKRMEQP